MIRRQITFQLWGRKFIRNEIFPSYIERDFLREFQTELHVVEASEIQKIQIGAIFISLFLILLLLGFLK